MSAPSMKLKGPADTELRHFLAIYIMCSCDLDLWPTYPKIGSCDQDHILKICAYFKVYRPLRFLYIRSYNSDFVAPLLGNQFFHANRFVPHLLGVFHILPSKYELDTTTQSELLKFIYWIRYVTLWPWPLTFWPWSHVTWLHVCGQSLYQVWTWYDLPFQSLDDYNFPLTASLKSKFLRFFGVKGVKFQI